MDADGLERIVQGLIAIAGGSTIMAFPAALLILADERILLYKDVVYAANQILPVNWVPYLLGAGAAFIVSLCWVNVIVSIMMMVMYVTSQSSWMTILRTAW